ncbi:MAG TPA: MarR family transcriptional regulator [Friedmanniella sp.]
MTELPDLTSTQVATQLRAVVGRLRRQLREYAGTTGLTPSQASALTRLAKGEAATASGLAELEGVRPQSMAATLAALAAAGLVQRSPDPRDGRQQLIGLTPTGHAFFAGARAEREEWLAHAIADRYSPAELQQIGAVLTLLDRLTAP